MYIISFVSIFFNLQIYSILQSKNKSRKTKNSNKIIINRKEIEIETKIIETSIETNAKTNAKTAVAAATTTTNRKYLLRLRKQFVYIYVSFALKTILNYLLLFNNL